MVWYTGNSVFQFLSTLIYFHFIALGILVGGGMFYFVDGKKRGRMAAFAAMIEGFILLPFTFAFLMGCSTLDIVGVTHTTFNNRQV